MLFVMTPYQIEDIEILQKAGADALIFSTPFFSVRGLHSFELPELPLIKQICEQLKVKMFVQVNRFFVESELPRLYEHMKHLKELQVDGIYFGDEAVLAIGEELAMSDSLIYQPDTLLTNSADVNFYLQQGLHSVALAKEITLEEMIEIAKHTEAKKLEVMIHGRMNMMHSKRKLLSNYATFLNKEGCFEGRSNLYLMEENREEHMPILEDETGTHIFSGFTLCSFEEIKEMQEAGIGYVRIEGFGKTLEDVLRALKHYKEILAGQEDAHVVYEEYQNLYPQDHYSKGFLYMKTSKSK